MTAQRRRRGKEGGRKGRRIARATSTVDAPPYITRKVPVYELASEELLALVEDNTEIVLEEIGIDFRDDPREPGLAMVHGGDVLGPLRH